MTRALGCMRLSTDPARDDERGLAVIHAALDAGITLLDTADVYCHSAADLGHNERLIARALAGRSGVRVVTKGGLTRPDGAWVPDGRAKHLAAAARASRDRLGTIAMYLLHVVDPKTPLATSARALAKLRDEGIVKAVGLSNVTLTQLEEAETIVPIGALQLELHPWKLDALRGGLVAACEARGIELYVHRPLDGPKGVKRAAKDPVLAEIAERYAATPSEIVLAWLRSLSPAIVPLPGATRIATAKSAARLVELDASARETLNERFVTVRGARPPAGHVAHEARKRGQTPFLGEVVIVIGIPGAGKSTLAERYVAAGYLRLNRDERGGSLLDLSRALDDALSAGATRVVLDNTYPSRASRAPVIDIARRHGLAIRCVVLGTPFERAQHNAAARMLALHDRLLEPAELAKTGNIAPRVQFQWRRSYEPPRTDEGFDAIEEVPFVARPATGSHPALLVELDDVVWRGRPRSVEKVQLRDGAAPALAAWQAAGYAIAATTWQPGVPPETIAALVAHLREVLALPLAIAWCTHAEGPPLCWCRKPMPGLGLYLARRHDLALDRTLCAGSGPADKGFALRVGVPFHDVAHGWPRPPADKLAT